MFQLLGLAKEILVPIIIALSIKLGSDLIDLPLKKLSEKKEKDVKKDEKKKRKRTRRK